MELLITTKVTNSDGVDVAHLLCVMNIVRD